MQQVHRINQTMELKECKDQWIYNKEYDCFALENILYTPVPGAEKFQRLSIYVPSEYMNEEGTIVEGTKARYSSRTAPVVFENNASGYAEMEHTFLGGPRNYASRYLKRGMIYVTCGCRGRQTTDEEGNFMGKSPASLVDFKTAIRFLRHNRQVLPGNMERMISVGWSAGGAMSALLGCTGNNHNYDDYLKQNGAFMDESDQVFAAQVYCPIIDLEHADLAYEWQFQGFHSSEPSPFAPGGEFSEFQKALSEQLASRYTGYFNEMALRHPKTGELLQLDWPGRSGSAYLFLMDQLEYSATDYFLRLENGSLEETYSVSDYLNGNYDYKVVDIEKLMAYIRTLEQERSTKHVEEPPMKVLHGKDKNQWLSWDGSHAHISSLTDYHAHHRGRMKSCPSFDQLSKSSPENQVFGDRTTDYLHFSKETYQAILSLQERFPQECSSLAAEYQEAELADGIQERIRLINPYAFIGTEEQSDLAKYFRIHVGACDADTSFMASMVLALKLWNYTEAEVLYGLIWDQPHCEADYKDEVCDWIDSIV